MRITRKRDLENRIFNDIRARKPSYPKKDPKRRDFALYEVTACLNKSWLKRYKEYPVPETLELLFALGNASEDILTGGRNHPKSICVDGVWMGMDSLGYRDESSLLPWECKLTYAGIKKPINDRYRCQMLSYMRGLNVTYPDKDPIYAFAMPMMYLMPDWSNMMIKKPQLRVWLCEADGPEELEANWRQVLRRKESLDLAVQSDTPPSDRCDDYCESWECKGCECWEDCPAPKSPSDKLSKEEKDKWRVEHGKPVRGARKKR